MTPLAWVAIAYGIVIVTLVAYLTRLRRRLRHYTAGHTVPGSQPHRGEMQ